MPGKIARCGRARAIARATGRSGSMRLERAELRDPGVAELAHVGRRAADVGRDQLLVRRRPGHLLHDHVDAGVLALEVRHELLHHLALASHGPEAERRRARAGARAARHRGEREQRSAPTSSADSPRALHRAAPARSSQPPLEAGGAQPAHEVRRAAHALPDEPAAPVLDHQHDESLVDARGSRGPPSRAWGRCRPARGPRCARGRLYASRKPYRPHSAVAVTVPSSPSAPAAPPRARTRWSPRRRWA